MSIVQERGRLGGAIRAGNKALAAEARARMNELVIERYIRSLVDSAPELTAEQRDRLALLLRAPSSGDAA